MKQLTRGIIPSSWCRYTIPKNCRHVLSFSYHTRLMSVVGFCPSLLPLSFYIVNTLYIYIYLKTKTKMSLDHKNFRTDKANYKEKEFEKRKQKYWQCGRLGDWLRRAGQAAGGGVAQRGQSRGRRPQDDHRLDGRSLQPWGLCNGYQTVRSSGNITISFITLRKCFSGWNYSFLGSNGRNHLFWK